MKKQFRFGLNFDRNECFIFKIKWRIKINGKWIRTSLMEMPLYFVDLFNTSNVESDSVLNRNQRYGISEFMLNSNELDCCITVPLIGLTATTFDLHSRLFAYYGTQQNASLHVRSKIQPFQVMPSPSNTNHIRDSLSLFIFISTSGHYFYHSLYLW